MAGRSHACGRAGSLRTVTRACVSGWECDSWACAAEVQLGGVAEDGSRMVVEWSGAAEGLGARGSRGEVVGVEGLGWMEEKRCHSRLELSRQRLSRPVRGPPL